MARADVTILPGLNEILYAAKGGSATTSDLYRVNPDTGVCTSIGPIGFAVTGMDFHPVTNVLYAVTNGNSAVSPRALISINTVTGVGTFIATLNISAVGNKPVADIAFKSNGTLYGWYVNGSDLVSIHLISGVLTIIGNSGVSGFGYAMSFDSNDTLWLLPEGEEEGLYSVSTDTGVANLIVSTTGGDGNNEAFNAGAFSPLDIFHVIYSKEYDGDINPLQRVNTATGAIIEIGNTLSEIDALAWQF